MCAWWMTVGACLGLVACEGPAPFTTPAPNPTADVPAWRCARERPSIPAPVTRCNGSEALCGRRYHDVVYATAHEASSNDAWNFIAARQRYGLSRQLEDGVRALTFEVRPFLGDVWLCDGACEINRIRLAEGLCEVGRFLDREPGAVVTVFIESHAGAPEVAQAFSEARLLDDLYAHTPGNLWPTLGDLVTLNRRLVVFTDRDGDTYAWYHDASRWVQDTPADARAASDLDCRRSQGDAANPLFVLNHFLADASASRLQAATLNRNPLLLDRALRCRQERGRIPNFIAVDFYDVGDVIATVEALNTER